MAHRGLGGLALSLGCVAADAGGARIGDETTALRGGTSLTGGVGAEHARPVGPHTWPGSVRSLAQQCAVPGFILAPWWPPGRSHSTLCVVSLVRDAVSLDRW